MNQDPSILLPWSKARTWAFRFCAVFVLLFMLTLSFPHPHIPDIPSVIAPVFEKLVRWTGDEVIGIGKTYTEKLISDSTGLYIHVMLLMLISAIVSTIWMFAEKRKRNYYLALWWFRVIMSYYLAFHLLVYGFNKIFKWQFYQPEPNTLFTTLGDTYRDLLYWSTMGTSHSYNLFLGIIEVIAAALLLLRKTRVLGALIAIGIMTNIVMINFSFDISVKIYSLFLLGLAIGIIIPERRRLYAFFFTNRKDIGSSWQPVYVRPATIRFYHILKPLVIAYMLWSVFTVYVRSGNYNDDRSARPRFHGAYDVISFVKNNDTIPPLQTDPSRWKRVFIHRRDYFIIQGMNDQMQDFLFKADTIKHRWSIEEERSGWSTIFDYSQASDSVMQLNGIIGKDTLQISLKKIDLNKLNLMKKEFNWTID